MNRTLFLAGAAALAERRPLLRLAGTASDEALRLALGAEVMAEHGQPHPAADPVLRYLGGEFTLPDAQVPWA